MTADFEKGVVELFDDVRAREDEVVVAALFAAKVFRGEVVALDRGAHGAVEKEDTVLQRVEEGGVAVGGGTIGQRGTPEGRGVGDIANKFTYLYEVVGRGVCRG